MIGQNDYFDFVFTTPECENRSFCLKPLVGEGTKVNRLRPCTHHRCYDYDLAVHGKAAGSWQRFIPGYIFSARSKVRQVHLKDPTHQLFVIQIESTDLPYIWLTNLPDAKEST